MRWLANQRLLKLWIFISVKCGATQVKIFCSYWWLSKITYCVLQKEIPPSNEKRTNILHNNTNTIIVFLYNRTCSYLFYGTKTSFFLNISSSLLPASKRPSHTGDVRGQLAQSALSLLSAMVRVSVPPSGICQYLVIHLNYHYADCIQSARPQPSHINPRRRAQ